MRKLIIAASTSIALMGFSAATMAQEAAPQQQEQTMQKVSDAKLMQVSDAMNEVRAISGKYAQAFKNAEDQTKAKEIQQKAQQEMIDAVSESGLSAGEYNTIVKRLQQDKGLQKRMMELAE